MRSTVQSLSLIALAALLVQTASAGVGDLPGEPYIKRANDASVIVIPMGYRDGLLTNYINIGNPPELFEMALDTGSGLAWVPSTKCTSQNCEGQKLYDPEISSTARSLELPPKKLEYEDGKCLKVDLYSDQILFDNDVNQDEILTFENIAIGAGYAIEGFNDTQEYLGYFGFGGSGGINTADFLTKRALQSLYRRGLVKRSALGDVGGRSNQMGVVTLDQGGYVPDRKRDNDATAYCIVGGIDEDLIDGEPVYIPLPSEEECGEERFWKLKLDSVTCSDSVEIPKGTYGKFYSSSPFIHAPKEQAEALHNSIGAEYNSESGFYELPCAELDHVPDLSFHFGSNTVTLPPSNWIKAVPYDDQICRSLVKNVTTKTKNWLLGTAVTNAFYMVYDFQYEQLGFGYIKSISRSGTVS
ncbi:aspartic peptidase domain-containing protein [Fennellomyces sp. T-0311]|nr:aspartic peptidase domain-containing protein [Fennellomyces sp. T-0311]